MKLGEDLAGTVSVVQDVDAAGKVEGRGGEGKPLSAGLDDLDATAEGLEIGGQVGVAQLQRRDGQRLDADNPRTKRGGIHGEEPDAKRPDANLDCGQMRPALQQRRQSTGGGGEVLDELEETLVNVARRAGPVFGLGTLRRQPTIRWALVGHGDIRTQECGNNQHKTPENDPSVEHASEMRPEKNAQKFVFFVTLPGIRREHQQQYLGSQSLTRCETILIQETKK